MTDTKKLIEKRKATKSRKPKFLQQDAHKKARLKNKWRRPRGSDSKMRQHFKSYNKSVEPGYGSPEAVKHLHSSGLKPVMVANIKEAAALNKEKEAAIIKASVGAKKKIDIIKKLEELGIKIISIKDTKKYIENIEAKLKIRKEGKAKKEKKKEEKKKEEKKEEKKEDKLAEKIMTEEEKAAAEKKEKDKLLTKKGAL